MSLGCYGTYWGSLYEFWLQPFQAARPARFFLKKRELSRRTAVLATMAWQIKRLGDDVQTPLYDDLFAARRYRVEAERCRAISDIMRNDDARKSMREVASYYEKLANRHERRPIALAGVGTPSNTLMHGADNLAC
jgi:hypothetical protein